MVDATYYYRTAATKTTAITSLPAAQKLDFVAPLDVLEFIEEDYELNIKQYSPPTPGIRRTNLIDNGLLFDKFLTRGYFKTGQEIVSMEKIKTFRRLRMQNTDFPQGIFGIFHETATPFNIDPNSNTGLMLKGITWRNESRIGSIYDFSIRWLKGGLDS